MFAFTTCLVVAPEVPSKDSNNNRQNNYDHSKTDPLLFADRTSIQDGLIGEFQTVTTRNQQRLVAHKLYFAYPASVSCCTRSTVFSVCLIGSSCCSVMIDIWSYIGVSIAYLTSEEKLYVIKQLSKLYQGPLYALDIFMPFLHFSVRCS